MCDLCKLVKIGYKKERIIYRDEIMTVTTCRSCRTVLVVWNHHGFPPEKIKKEMLKIAQRMFPNLKPRMENHAIFDHYHFHLE